MRDRDSEARRKMKYKEKWNYWLSAGIYFLFAVIWVVIAVDRLKNSTQVIAGIAAVCAVGFLTRAGHELYAYVRDRKNLHIKVLKSRGSLRFWGDWFGRPADNIHTVVSTEFFPKDNRLVLHFADGETCTIYNPAGIVNEKEEFRIKDASRIEWQWHAYGPEHSAQTLCKRIYTRKDNNVVVIESFGELEKGTKVLHYHELNALEID